MYTENTVNPTLVLEDICFNRPSFLKSGISAYGEEAVILKNISLIVQSGDRVGLMGLNGAGKTTLLQLLAGILRPTSGRYAYQGKISTMLTSSLGMKQEATGYENIRMMATLMGIDYKEMRQLDRYVEDFTELGEKLRAPIKTYSNGMRTRLGFAISTYIDPTILLIDEVISAGDDVFRAKASKRIEDMMSSSGIVILASHGMGILRQFCNKALILEAGEVDFFGDVNLGIEHFRAKLNARK